MATDNNGWELAPLCRMKDCEVPAQVYLKVSMSSKKGARYLKTCCKHTYEHLEQAKNDKA
jgi:hypothetical protein